jgi:putative ABC transport system permease protein
VKTINQIKMAAKGLRTNKGRSFLTILGIVIGIMSIILVMAIGRGAQDLILSEVKGLGSTTMIVIPGREPTGPGDPSGMLDTIMSDSLKNRELEALSNKNNVQGVKRIIPVVFGSDTASYGSSAYRPTIIGGGAGIMDVFDKTPAAGRVFTEDEVKSNSAVVIIGSRVKDELFGESDAIGQRIKIKNKSFQVIGVLGEVGQSSLFDFDKSAIMPVSTAQFYLFGIRYFNRLIVQVKSEDLIPQTKDDIERTLRNLHSITDSDKDDFFIVTQTEIVKTISSITNALTLLLVSIAAISLLVGGVGIMNIMLVSVTERTREIGLRKAMGATKSDIMTQFIYEAIILTLTGGITGILIGAILNYVITSLIRKFGGLSWTYAFPISAAVTGVTVAAAIGLIFGLYPAMQASRKSPIEALRYE